MSNKIIYKIKPEKHNEKDLKRIIQEYPELKFVSLMAVDLYGNSTEEKIPIKEFVKDIDNYYSKLSIKEEEKIIFNLPKENSLRTLLKYQKLDKTNIKYPRRYSEIIKRDI